MKFKINTDQSFTEPFHYFNSDYAIRRFPFPFVRDEYDYALNVEPHTRKPSVNNLATSKFMRETDEHVFYNTFDVDEHYLTEMRDKDRVMKKDPTRFSALPHMRLHGWDLVEVGMECLSRDYPELFTLERNGNQWHWINKPMDMDIRFTFLDDSTIPYHPMEFICRQMQGDFTLMDQRDNHLWIDASMNTGPADWSGRHDVGMSFFELHGPVPKGHEIGMFSRAEQFLMGIKQGAPARRTNWTLTCNPRMDTSPEAYDVWGVDRSKVTAENVPDYVYLRVECQVFVRMPRSNGLLFIIRTYLGRFGELFEHHQEWGRRMYRVLNTIDTRIATYKGFEPYKPALLKYLSKFEDGKN